MSTNDVKLDSKAKRIFIYLKSFDKQWMSMVEMIKLEMSKFELMALGINHARHAYLSFFLLLLDYQIPIQIIFYGYTFFCLHSNNCLRRIIILNFFFCICVECFYKARSPWNERWKVKNHSNYFEYIIVVVVFFVHLFLNMSYECVLNIWTPTNNKTTSTFGNQTHLVFNQFVFDVWQVQNAKTLENQIEHARKRLFERH